MKIGELSKRTGIAAHTIRFYESEGLLSEVARAENGYRQYQESDIECLSRIQVGQNIGLSLNDIRSMAESKENDKDNWNAGFINQKLDQKLADIQQTRIKLDLQEAKILLIKHNLEQGIEGCSEFGGDATATDVVGAHTSVATK